MIFGGGRRERARQEAIVDIEKAFHETLRPRSLFSATLLLAEPTDLPRPRVVRLVRDLVEDAGGTVEEHEANDILNGLEREPGLIEFGKPRPEHRLTALWVGGVGVAVVVAPVRIRDIDGLSTFFSPTDWEWVGKDVKRHQAHVAIYDFGFDQKEQPTGPDAAFNRAVAVTSVAAALGEELGALAVCWNTASNALRREGLAAAREDIVKDRAPLDLWTRIYRTTANPGQHPGVITLGLAPFTGCELEILSSQTDVQTAQNFLRHVAVAMVDRGEAVQPGQVFRPDETTAARAEPAEVQGQRVWRFGWIDPWEA